MTPKVMNAATEGRLRVWFDMLANKNDEWKRDDANTSLELFDRTVQRLGWADAVDQAREFLKYQAVAGAEFPGQPEPGGEVVEDADRRSVSTQRRREIEAGC